MKIFRNSGSNTCDITALLPIAAVFIMKGFNASISLTLNKTAKEKELCEHAHSVLLLEITIK